MHISLRKAAALQKEILNVIPTVSTTASVSIYSENPIGDLVDQELAMLDAIALRASLMRALREIRSQTAMVNMTSGVHDLVTKASFIDKDIAFISGLATSVARSNDSVINGKMERAKAQDPAHYNFQEEVLLWVFSQESIESFTQALAVLKKEKVRIQDELLELNIKNNIHLSEDTVKVLTDAGLI